MAVGINRYKAWPRLYNAVDDAKGAVAAFQGLGFEEFRPALLDDEATGPALQTLVTSDLKDLSADDSLVLFFAGHGATGETAFHDGRMVKYGYIVPVEGGTGSKSSASWLRLKNWLADVALLPPKHILVILDACHSGIALDAVLRTRGEPPKINESLQVLRSRRSRRVISSALDDQLALDEGGPLSGHSLFTGCLIDGLRGGVVGAAGKSAFTGTELGLYVQNQVTRYASVRPQTPDFGTLEWDNRGELVFEVPETAIGTGTDGPPAPVKSWQVTAPGKIWPKGMSRDAVAQAVASPQPVAPVGTAALFPKSRPKTSSDADSAPPVKNSPVHVAPPASPPRERETDTPPEPRREPVQPLPAKPPERKPRPTPTPPLASAFVNVLKRHQQARDRGQSGDRVISVVQADATTSLTAWATWAASNGQLTIISHKTDLDEVVTDVLDHLPWLRILPAARERFAKAAGISAAEVDTALRTRDHEQRADWIREIARTDLRTHVSGWLCTEFRGTWAHLPNFGAAPVQGTELLAALTAIGAPIAVMLVDTKPSDDWFARALQCAYELAAYMPRQPLAVGVTESLARTASTTLKSALQTVVFDGQAPVGGMQPRVKPDSHNQIVERLVRALSEAPATRERFAANAIVHTHDGSVNVDLHAADELLAVQIDDWYHNRDPQAYHRARKADIALQRAGTFVLRFLAEDVEHDLERVVHEITTDVSARHAVVPPTEKAT